MKKHINRVISNPLFSGSVIMMVGVSGINFINYIYHLIMGRTLGPSSYGELSSLLSLMGIIGMIPFSLSLVIIKYISSARTEKEINSFVFELNKLVLYGGLVVGLIIILTSPLISRFLNMNSPLEVILVGIYFFFAFPAFFNRSALQGLLRFKEHTISLFMENIFKLGGGVILVILGFATLGAMEALVLAVVVGWLSSKYFIKDQLKFNGGVRVNVAPLIKYSFPVLIQSIALASLLQSDLVLVKHFFGAENAGIYAALSTLGKIIFFAAGPVGAVMFPIISQKYSKGEKFISIFIYSFIVTLFVSLVIFIVYNFYPVLIVESLYGSLYTSSASLLVWFAAFMLFYTLSSLIINFFLSLGLTYVVLFPTLAAFGQWIGIIIYHKSILEVITVSVIISALLLIILVISLVFYLFNFRKETINSVI